MQLAIQDDGKGFDAREERGMGLLGIEERVGYLGGTFPVDSRAGRGHDTPDRRCPSPAHRCRPT